MNITYDGNHHTKTVNRNGANITFYYDETTKDLLGSEFEFPSPPPNSIEIAAPSVIAVGSVAPPASEAPAPKPEPPAVAPLAPPTSPRGAFEVMKYLPVAEAALDLATHVDALYRRLARLRLELAMRGLGGRWDAPSRSGTR